VMLLNKPAKCFCTNLLGPPCPDKSAKMSVLRIFYKNEGANRYNPIQISNVVPLHHTDKNQFFL
jgi:hypothetical protein